MESFSLLKYWRGGGGAALAATPATTASSNTHTTTITTTVHTPPAETEDDGNSDEGPFFDLEFAMPSEEDHEGLEGDSDEGEEREIDFVVSSEGSCGGDGLPSESCLTLSPSDDLFFKGRLLPLEPSSLVFSTSEHDSKHQLPALLLKSATKFRVFLLGFRKPKSPVVEPHDAIPASPKQQQQHSKFFIKFKVEEVPFVSLFTRDHSSRIAGQSCGVAKLEAEDALAATGPEEKKFTKEMLQKYLNKIKPLYIRVSKRYAEKLRFSGQLSSGEVVGKVEPKETDGGEKAAVQPVVASIAEGQKPQVGHLPAGLRVVRKHLGKSKSASSVVVAAAPPAVHAQRRDDTLLQQQDGIQSAIAHCKRSLNAAAKGSESPLMRSMSEPVRSMSGPDDSRSEMVKADSS